MINNSGIKVSNHVDWLSVTYPKGTGLKLIVPYAYGQIEEISSPIKTYETAYRDKVNGVVILSSKREKMGVHVIYTGKVMQLLREKGEEFIPYDSCLVNGGKVTRIDLAIDIVGDERVTPETIMSHLPDIKTQMVGDKFIGSIENGYETFYIGNPKSQRRKFRVYNKAVEQGIQNEIWTRIEYEKRYNAMATARAYYEKKQSIGAIIKSVVDFPLWSVWAEIVGTATAKVPRVERYEVGWKETLEWILSSAIPAIVNATEKELLESGNSLDKSIVVNTVMAVLSAKLKKLDC